MPQQGSKMLGKETDIAALLIGVFAVGVGPLVSTSPWDPINSVVCIPVLVVLWVYSLHYPTRRPKTLTPERVAIATVFGFIVSISFGWPSQAVFHLDPVTAYYPALVPGFVVGFIVWCWWPGPRPSWWPLPCWPDMKPETKSDDVVDDSELTGISAPEESR